MSAATTTRRGILLATAAACAASASGIVGSAALARPSATGGCEDWDRAYAAFLAASKASDDHWEMVEEPTVLELERRAPRPPKTFSIPARSGQVRTFEFDPAEPDKWDGTGRQFADAARPLKAQWQTYEREYPLARAALDVDAISDASNAHLDAISDAEDRLFQTAAPHFDAIRIKLELLWADERDPIPGFNALVLADVQRLTSQEGR